MQNIYTKYIITLLGILGIGIVYAATAPAGTIPQTRGDVCVYHQGDAAHGSGWCLSATTTSDVGRGVALSYALSACTNGDTFVLASTTFDLGSRTFDASCNKTGGINVQGAGKFATIIKSSTSGHVMFKFGNGTYSGLYLNTTATQGIPMGYSLIDSDFVPTNVVIHDVYTLGQFDGVVVTGGGTASQMDISNWSCSSNFDCINWSDIGGRLRVYDSDLSVAYAGVSSLMRCGTSDSSTIYLYNTSCTMTDAVGSHTVYGWDLQSGTLHIAGGTWLTPQGETTSYNFRQVGGTFGVTSNTIYTIASTTGTITHDNQASILNSIAGGYGTSGYLLTSGGAGVQPSWTAPAGGGTVSSGLTGQNAYYAANGTTVSGTNLLFLDTANSRIGIGTTTPNWTLDTASTLPNIALTDTDAGANLKHWVLQNNAGTFTLGTTSDSFVSNTNALFNATNAGVLTWRGKSTTFNMELGSKVSFEIPTGAGNISMVRFGETAPASGEPLRVFQFTNNGDSTEYFSWDIGVNGNPTFNLHQRQFIWGKAPGATFIQTAVLKHITSGSGTDVDPLFGLATTSPWGELSINPNATNGALPSLVVGSSTGTNFIVDNGGRVGVGTTSPWRSLSVSGTLAVSALSAFATGDSAVCQRGGGEFTVDSGVSSCIVSTKAAKHNIQKELSDEAYARVMKLQPVVFEYNGTNKPDIGLIAEDVAAIDPRYAQYDPKTLKPKAINWAAITADMIAVIQAEHGVYNSTTTPSKTSDAAWLGLLGLAGFAPLLKRKKSDVV